MYNIWLTIMLFIVLNLHLIIVLAFIILIQQLSTFGSSKTAYKKFANFYTMHPEIHI